MTFFMMMMMMIGGDSDIFELRKAGAPKGLGDRRVMTHWCGLVEKYDLLSSCSGSSQVRWQPFEEAPRCVGNSCVVQLLVRRSQNWASSGGTVPTDSHINCKFPRLIATAMVLFFTGGGADT